jgi:hypothetical protein
MIQEWEAGWTEGGSRDRWVRLALLVGGGKGRLEARGWANRLLVSPGPLEPSEAQALVPYHRATGDDRVLGLLPPGPAPLAGCETLVRLLEDTAQRDAADELERLARTNPDLLLALVETSVLAGPRGLWVALYAPVTAKTRVAGVPVELECETESPEALKAALRVYPESPVEFSLFLRVPGWAEGLLITGDGAQGGAFTDLEGWVEIRRTWSRGDSLDLTFEASPE